MIGRDWRTMTPTDFDTAATETQLAILPASDLVGTGDLLELLEGMP